MKAHNPTFLCLVSSVLKVFGAETGDIDKSRFHLFNPTPRELLRELSADRPDKTESAYTVDAGHFQIEMDVLNYTYDRHNTERSNTRAESVGIAPMNLKLGLLNNLDLQVVLESYTSIRVHDLSTGVVEKRRGFGDMIVRTKLNLWGNDAGTTALALMPFIKLPTNQDDLGNNSVEGGIIAPLAVALPAGWGMGMMTEVDFVRDSVEGGHHPEFVNTLTFSHGIVGKLAGYIEFFSLVSTESDADWVGTLDCGLTYSLTDDIQLDAGLNIGLTRSADDLSPFIGLTWRF
jgi:hypothetical protein